jgi:hypothetical protein
MSNVTKVGATIDTAALRDDLNSLQLGLGKEVGKMLQRAIEPLVAPTRALAPYDPEHDRKHRKDGLPHLRDTIVVGGSSATSARLVSDHPAAAIFEWNDGITPAIAPRGVPLTIKAVQMAHKAAEQRIQKVEATVADGVSALIAKHGL